MKPWLLIFAAGLVAGIALGLLVAKRGGAPGSGAGRAAGTGRLARSADGGVATSKSGGRDALRTRKVGERREGWQAGQPRLGIAEYLRSLKDIQGMQEINFMELMRQGHQITMLSEDEARGMLEYFGEQTTDEGGDSELHEIAFALVFARWAELNGPAAMQYALTIEEGIFVGDEDDLMAVGMGAWVEADPVGATDWFRANAGTGDERLREILEDDDVQEAFFAALARTDKEAAQTLILEAGDIIDGDAVEIVARGETSAEGLREMLESAGPENGTAQRGILAEWSQRDPSAAAAWLDAQSPTEHHGELVFEVGQQLVDQDPAAGAEWMMRQEVGSDLEENRLATVASRWANQDAAAAGAWLDQQADVPARDNAELSLASKHARNQNWDEAFRWTAEIGNEQTRKRALHQVLNNGWDSRKQEFRGDSLEAAQAAGFGTEAEELRQRALQK